MSLRRLRSTDLPAIMGYISGGVKAGLVRMPDWSGLVQAGLVQAGLALRVGQSFHKN